MMHSKSESDVTSLAPSSPSRSPKRPIYYVQSPSRDSQDGDKSCSMQATPTYNSPTDSPLHPSMGRHSRNSSASRFSGIFRSSSGRKGSKKHRSSSNNHNSGSNDKGWPECKVIMEEGGYDHDDKVYSRRVQILIGLLSFVVLFTVFCLIIWGAARPYKAHVSLKSLVMKSFIIQEGTDFSGVPTRLVTVNSSLKISIRNPATFFGIHVSSSPINLQYSKMTVAIGQLVKHYQPRKSTRSVMVNLEGDKVPLYGAGSNLTASLSGNAGYDQLPFTLDFEVRQKGYVVGKLVTTSHRGWISCPLMVNYTSTKPIRFKKNSCTFS